MDVRIGLRHVARELSFTTDQTAEAVIQEITQALAGGRAARFTDAQGHTWLIPGDGIGYVETGEAAAKTVGFRA